MTVSGFPSPIDATVAGNFTVTLKDKYGNIASGHTGTAADGTGHSVRGYTGKVRFSTPDPQATVIDPARGNSVLLQGFSYAFTASYGGTKTFTAVPP